jgi:hypothetical protein
VWAYCLMAGGPGTTAPRRDFSSLCPVHRSFIAMSGLTLPSKMSSPLASHAALTHSFQTKDTHPEFAGYFPSNAHNRTIRE